MKNSNLWLQGLFALALAISLSACCCCEDDEDTTCPDLIVQSIDPFIDVDCPGGAGTCVTTVIFTVANVGTADAGAFNINIVLDPGASVSLNEFVPGGLGAGDFMTITVTSPPGGNCYDPDCSVDIFVDNTDNVSECDEDNNKGTQTILG